MTDVTVDQKETDTEKLARLYTALVADSSVQIERAALIAASEGMSLDDFLYRAESAFERAEETISQANAA
jgi:hypothetical protein